MAAVLVDHANEDLFAFVLAKVDADAAHVLRLAAAGGEDDVARVFADDLDARLGMRPAADQKRGERVRDLETPRWSAFPWRIGQPLERADPELALRIGPFVAARLRAAGNIPSIG